MSKIHGFQQYDFSQRLYEVVSYPAFSMNHTNTVGIYYTDTVDGNRETQI